MDLNVPTGISFLSAGTITVRVWGSSFSVFFMTALLRNKNKSLLNKNFYDMD
jgi:hypothetical protein